MIEAKQAAIVCRERRQGISLIAMATAGLFAAQTAAAQTVPPPNIVGACAGVALPRSVVTDIMSPVVSGIVNPLQGTVNSILAIGGLSPLIPPTNIDPAGLLANAAAGNAITLQVLNANGTIVGPGDRCDLAADGFSLDTPQGLAIGGNRITGLGAVGPQAVAGEGNSIAFGNGAVTDATAAGSLALGTGAQVGAGATGGIALGNGAAATGANGVALGAGSVAARGPLAGYTAVGLAGTQNSAGEISVGAAGAERQITNVAAGVAATDAANVGQVTGVAVQVAGNTTAITNLGNQVVNGAIGPVRYADAGAPTTPNGGTPSSDLTLVGAAAGSVGLHNVAGGTIAVGSTDAVNGGQLNTTNQSVLAAQGTADTALALGNNAVQYGPARASVIFNAGGAATVLGNVAAGVAPTDAVNVGQLGATNAQVTVNTTAITNLGNRITTIANGGAGPVQYADAATPTTPNGGIASNDLTLVGGAAGAVALHNVAGGAIAAGSTDAVNGDQVFGLTQTVANAVAYDTDAGGVRINAVTLAGGDPAAPVTIVNLAAGIVAAGSTQAVNGGQLATTNVAVTAAQGTADAALALGGNAVQYGPTRTSVTFNAGGAATVLGNVAAGVAPTDAVNAGQLGATNAQVALNTTAITNIANGAAGPVQYANAATPTTPNGGIASNDLTLVGGAAGPVALHNVAGGAIAAGSTDAVTGGQVFGLALTAVNAVSYDSDATGVRTNTVTLSGGNAAAPVTVANVAAGTVAAGSTQAVNGAQLAATNQGVAAAQGTANTALTLGSNAVQYGPTRTNVTFNNGGAATVLSNVGAGTAATDAANMGQLNAGMNSAVTQSNAYTDGRIAALDFDVRSVRRDGYAGTSGALAAAGLPQAYEAGKGMIAIGGGTYGGQSAVAIGFSKAFEDGHVVARLSGTYDSRGRGGASGGVGYQF